MVAAQPVFGEAFLSGALPRWLIVQPPSGVKHGSGRAQMGWPAGKVVWGGTAQREQPRAMRQCTPPKRNAAEHAVQWYR